MAQFSVNAQRFDPYKNFKFRVQVGRPVRGGRQQGRRPEAHHRSGQAPRGGRPEHEPQVAGSHRVRRHHPRAGGYPRHRVRASGRTRSGTSGRAWGIEVSLKDFRKDIMIEVYNEAGQLVLAYKVYRCWVSEFQAAARPRRQRQRRGDPAHQARERRVGARLRRARADASQRTRCLRSEPTVGAAAMGVLTASELLFGLGAGALANAAPGAHFAARGGLARSPDPK